MKCFALALGWLAAMICACAGEELRYSPIYPPGIPQFSYSWSPLPLLPPRFQNHCGYFNGNYVCANHCGPNYQFYYCSDWSSGCCHIGLGYCNPGGVLHCNPHYFPFY
ncbi:MAG: hypothetical protein WAL15_00550 [Xanthobacteraceae bacterium]|jgi:hypothetical protein